MRIRTALSATLVGAALLLTTAGPVGAHVTVRSAAGGPAVRRRK